MEEKIKNTDINLNNDQKKVNPIIIKSTKKSSQTSTLLKNKNQILTNNINTIGDNTLNESILTSLLRDLLKIIYKIKFVLNPFSKSDILNKEILDWDLWGPLIFTILLSFFQTSIHQQNQFMLIFFIFWIGAFHLKDHIYSQQLIL